MVKQNLIPAVGYLRMSTDQQEDSPARQRSQIEAMAKRDGFKIIEWYEDHGLTGTESANRPDFLRLLNDASGGKFQAILTSELSRMSREDIFDAMAHWKILKQAGIRIVTAQRGELRFDDLSDVITAIVDQYGAREESVKIADRTVSGKLLCLRRGQRVGGALFAFDRAITDEVGNHVRRVHFLEKFQKPKSWQSELVPSSDTKAVRGVRWAFDAICDGKTLIQITREFNRRELKTTFGNSWDFSSVRRMLENPAYMGTLRAGFSAVESFLGSTRRGSSSTRTRTRRL